MKARLEEALVKDFPGVFRLLHEQEQRGGVMMPIHFGIMCGDGWEPIIRRLCEKLESRGVFAIQIKEKFGGLRFYIAGGTDVGDDVETAIREAEEESYRTCEQCGAPGKLRDGGWQLTLCDTCHTASKWKEGE